MKHLRNHFVIALFFVFILFYSVALSEAFQTDYQAIDRAAKSVFLVEVLDRNGEIIKTGSGFISFDTHCFITNHHVIEDASSLVIHSDQYEHKHTLTTLIAADKDKDIAILEFPEGKNYRSLSLAPDYQLFRGQPVTAIGSPQGVINTVSSGNISSILSYPDAPTDIQFTAPISGGSSGGALFNENGDVVGLIFSSLIGGEDMNYAIPIEYVIELYNAPFHSQLLIEYNGFGKYVDSPCNVSVSLNAKGYPTIQWSPVNDAEGYKVYRVEATGEDTLVAVKESSSDSATLLSYDKKPHWNTTSAYYVVAHNGAYTSKKSDIVIVDVNSKAISTPRPTPSPTPLPTLPESVLSHYEPGAKGDDILLIKKQLQKYGYYSRHADLGNEYNQTMIDRVSLFQKNNRLPETGSLDYSTLLCLFSQNPRCTDKFGNGPTPIPTVAPTPEPISYFALQIPNSAHAQWYTKNNNLYMKVEVTNTSKEKTITEFTLYFYPQDLYGRRLISDDQVHMLTTSTVLKPRKTKYSNYISMNNYSVDYCVFVGIKSVKYSDGTVLSVPDEKIMYYNWTIK